jgi:DNA replication and repair protein RecF
MKIQSITLENVRNYEKLDFVFPEEKVLILEGKNAQGKTNFLESIFMLALTKSFSPAKQDEVITWDKDYARIEGSVITNGDAKKIELFWGKGRQYPKTLKVNESKNKTEEYIGSLRVVLFTPYEMNIIPGSPNARRKYVNIILSQTDPHYLKNLAILQNTLKNRNALLKKLNEGLGDKSELTYWNDKLIEEGSFVYAKRRELENELNKTLSDHYSHIAGNKNDLKLKWKKELPNSEEEIKSIYKKKIQDSIARDIAVETTLSGPHRDDFILFLNEKNLEVSGSRGEWRSAILALKLGEIEYMEAEDKKTPILLLDDILSEFDQERQKNVLNLFHADQIIMTTTHVDKTPEDVAIYSVQNGTISKK